ncbi:2-aminoethylphosphonate--pyruvate transaminase [Gallalistipes aquisgranensis]|uniref:2-aminoethylphosphonate--pyruvate transaminase n=1 Tax=Gallalistipes aquisgranensis TaxID=2779358 RepID=UPI001CF82783|nr:2-aminoethylphosphonate--pyruvate transaminase [Gallalistipes aquisgranensis]MBE5032806.1 2-aminoethylphosphonate--pyruvate transaminase [Gallalistipes aquisgranensis]
MKRNYLLLTPGPLSTSETVREAMMQDWCTWDKDYNEGIVMPLRRGLLEIAGLDEERYTTVLLQGSGTYCVEATIGSSVGPKDKLLILANGAYGKRMARIADYYRIDYALVSLSETELITGDVARKALDAHPGITHLSMVHSETTTGLLNRIDEVAEVLRGRGITFIVDAMSSFGGVPIDIEKLGIDFLISSANKCIQGVPGFGFIIARREKMLATKGNARSLSLDIYDQWETMEQGKGKWRFTSPTHVVRAFYQAMQELKEEGGIAARHRRYEENHRRLVGGMRELGFRPLLSDDKQGCIITSFYYPSQDFDFQDFYNRLKAKGYVIYPGKISEADTFRIGNIGDIYPSDIDGLLAAVREVRLTGE